MKQNLILGLSLIGLVFFPLSSLAHHSHATIDKNKKVELVGTITELAWMSPHVYIKMDAPNPKGEIVNYTIETLNPSSLSRAGWDKNTLKPGDKVIWNGALDRDPNRAYGSMDWIEKIGGFRYYDNEDSMLAYLTEKNIDKDVYLGLSPLKPATKIGEGSWARVSETGGRAAPIRGPKKDWPYTELAAAEVAAFSEDQNPINQCVYPGIPKATTAPLNFHFSMADENTIRIERDLLPDVRLIHLNKDAPVGEPSTMGHSVGHYEGDVLVVETNNFVDDKWGTWTGVNSSSQKTLVEKYKLSEDGMMISVEITVTDPVYLKEPVTFMHYWGKIQDRPPSQAECSLENANYYLTAGYEE